MSSFESFRAVRWVRTLNLLLQAILFLTFVGGLNYVARNHPSRFDLTQYRRHTLSPETVSYLRNLSDRVQIYATVTDDAEIPIEVRGLLDEFVHATENAHGPIRYDVVNVYQDRRRAETLGLEMPGVLLLVCRDNRRAVPISELYAVRNEAGRVVKEAFQGEQKLMAAVLDVSAPERQHIYFLVGHGELQPDDTNPARGLSTLRNELQVRNFQVDTLDLSISRIPEDAALLVAVWPQTGYSRAEQEKLRQFLNVNAGRLMLLLAPGINAIRLGLDDLLLDWGVLVYDDVICETDPQYRTDDGDLVVRTYPDGKHPVTQTLVSHNLPLHFGFTRTVLPDPGRAAGSGLTTTTVAATSPTAWGDVGYRIGLPPKFSNAGNTHPLPGMRPEGRLGVVVASERVAPKGNLAFSVRAGRLIVFGSGDFVANQRIGSVGNGAIFLNAVNWAVERDRQINVPPRPIERFQLSLAAADLNRLNYALWFALPGGTALLGLIVYWTRRK